MIKAFEAKLNFLQIATKHEEEDTIKENILVFAQRNELQGFEIHIIHDYNIEEGINHFMESHDIAVIGFGTHGKEGLFQRSATETLINHLYKPIISYKIK